MSRPMTRRRRGTTPIEYSMIAALVSVIIIGAVISLGDNVEGMYDEIRAAVSP